MVAFPPSPSVSPQVDYITDPAALAEAAEQREQLDRNAAWLRQHAAEAYGEHRGLFLCVAGEQLFAADTAAEALALGRAAHPEDKGCFVRYVPRERRDRIYAHCR